MTKGAHQIQRTAHQAVKTLQHGVKHLNHQHGEFLDPQALDDKEQEDFLNEEMHKPTEDNPEPELSDDSLSSTRSKQHC